MAVVALAFSPDETLLASASADKTAKVWNPFQGVCVWTLEGHTKVCRALLIPHVCLTTTRTSSRSLASYPESQISRHNHDALILGSTEDLGNPIFCNDGSCQGPSVTFRRAQHVRVDVRST